MAGFCTKCGRPLPENGICPCTQVEQPAPQPEQPQYQQPQYQQPQYQAPQYQQPQYQQPQYQAPQYQQQPYQQQYQQPQYQPYQQQYQAPHQQPVQAPPQPKEPSAFGLAMADLPKKFIRFIKDPVAELKSAAEKKDMLGGIIGLALAVICCFFATLVYALRWKIEYAPFPVWAWLTVGMFAPVVAGGITLLGYFALSKINKVEADFKGILAVVGTGALVPAALTLTSCLLTLIVSWFFGAIGVVIFAVWAITAVVTVFHVYNVPPKALNILLLLGFFVVGYVALDSMRDWLVSSTVTVSSLINQGINDIFGDIFSSGW